MVSYRFCRPDDLPLISQAVQTCYNVHFCAEAEMTLARIKEQVAEVDLWASSCMVALEHGQPVAVLTGARREKGTQIYSLGVRPGYTRRGHGRHLLASLIAKLAILGPPHIAAEVPVAPSWLVPYFGLSGFAETSLLTDWHQGSQLAPLEGDGAIQAVKLAVLAKDPALWCREPAAWERQWPTLENRMEHLQCLVLDSGFQIEACLVYQVIASRECLVWRLSLGQTANRTRYGQLLLRSLSQRTGLPLSIPKLEDSELNAEALAGLGFRQGSQYQVMTVIARGT